MRRFPLGPRAVRLASALYRRATIGRVPKLFDETFYLRMNRDVARSGIDPFLHYVLRGADQGRNPAADFDTRFYREQSGPTGLDPLRHYLRLGAEAGHDPNPGFNSIWYASHHADVARNGANPLLHYRTHGKQEGRPTSRSAFGSPLPHMLRGVAAHHILDLPGETVEPFEVHLHRDLPVRACTDPVRRLCVFMRLTDAEIAGLTDAFETFSNGSLERLSLEIDPSHPPHPQRPTLLATLEHGYRGKDQETGTVLVRYAEAQLWDLRPSRPRIAAIHAGGSLAFRRGL
ncbi:hypothetical protein [Methylobacterium trifolii]|uniref:Uncharacterized protein n=1 Tax=Methylobacterium trifolii TaxID=1003092 RepID=A0ABQ4U4M8_9HYPH|nr:hypothetical protein [Methylobacterium trifolii]GJE61050.1 hypothetical protein MPOCJGCO_3171 [Methylobacterium trifolii]